MTAGPLICPGCGDPAGADDERFCGRCGSPLVLVEESPPQGDPLARERARKIHAPYAEGPLVRAGVAHNQAEAEMMQELLLDAGVPSIVRRSGGFDVPDFLAAGPRDLLVPAGGEEVARELLGTTAAARPVPAASGGARPWVRALAVALAVLLIAALGAAVMAALLE